MHRNGMVMLGSVKDTEADVWTFGTCGPLA
jgi:hypothetical protein